MEPGALQAGQSLVTQGSEKSELIRNQLDRSTSHGMLHSSNSEKPGSIHQDTTVNLGQSVEGSTAEGRQKKSNGGYGYYVVGEPRSKHLNRLVSASAGH